MLEKIKNYRSVRFVLCFVFCYILMCNIFINSFYHLKADQKVEKVVVKPPGQKEIVITSNETIEKINRQFHMQVLLSLGLGVLIENKEERYKVIFYNDKNREVKDFDYNPKNKKVYPGELELPDNTRLILDEMIYPANTKK